MDRRAYLKSIFTLGVAGTTSFSLYKWFDLNSPVEAKQLWDKQPIIAELAEIIIPRTDTPGARDAKVDLYIINVMLQCNAVKQQHKFCSGIVDLENYARNQYGRDFLQCNTSEKNEIVLYASKHSEFSYRILNKINNKFFGQPFFQKLKMLTVEGYCMSMAGATQGLAYDYIPGYFQSCIPYGKNQKSWATK